MDNSEIEKSLERIEKRLDRMERLLEAVEGAKTKKTWVRVGVIREVTMWNNEGMRRARENGLVKFKKTDDNGFMYLLESVHPLFIKKQ